MDLKSPSESMARALRWITLIVFTLALWHMFSARSPDPNTSQTTATTATNTDCAKKSQPLFPGFDIPLLPQTTAVVRSEVTVEGKGPAAFCGQDVTIGYRYWLRGEEDAPFYTSKNKDPKRSDQETVRLGDRKVLYGLEMGIAGMKIGEERTLTIPSDYAFDRDISTIPGNLPQAGYAGKTILSHVSLHNASPALPKSGFTPRIIDKTNKIGPKAFCGDFAYFHAKVWTLEGQLLYASGDTDDTPLRVRIGQGQLPLGIELGLEGMTEKSERLLLLPPAYVAPLRPRPEGSHKTAFDEIHWPKDQMVLVELTLMSALDREPEATPANKTKPGAAPNP